MAEDKTIPTAGRSRELAWLLAEWTSALRLAITAMGVPDSAIGRINPEDEHENPVSFWWEQQFGSTPGAWVRIGAEEPFLKQIGEKAVEAIGLDTPTRDDIHGTFLEILTQSLSALASSLTGRRGEEVVCGPGQEISSPDGAGIRSFVSLAIGHCDRGRACFVVSAPLLQMLGEDPAADTAAETAGPGMTDTAPAGRQGVAAYKSVLDVEVPISVSLGTARMSLEELLDVREGSSLRLTREAGDFVALRVHGREVARGEIIVARGQYAIRIQELSSLNDRLQQLSSVFWPQVPETASA